MSIFYAHTASIWCRFIISEQIHKHLDGLITISEIRGNKCTFTPAAACFALCQQNGTHERVNFLPADEKAASRQKLGIAIGVLVALVILAAASILIWLFVCEYDVCRAQRDHVTATYVHVLFLGQVK